jgi:acyl-homoserine-lactone acylase
VSVLTAWDHVFNPESKGALLFEMWASKFMGPIFTSEANFAKPFSLKDPVETPTGLKDSAAAVKMLGEAAVDTKAEFGSLERPYGDVTKYHAGDVSVPAGSGSGSIGIFPSMIFGKFGKDGTRNAISGETWISMVEFTTPLKAEGLMSYGNSTQPGTKHRSDQVAMLGERKLRTLWTTDTEVRKHLEETTTY